MLMKELSSKLPCSFNRLGGHCRAQGFSVADCGLPLPNLLYLTSLLPLYQHKNSGMLWEVPQSTSLCWGECGQANSSADVMHKSHRYNSEWGWALQSIISSSFFRIKARSCRHWFCAMNTDSKTLSDPLAERVQPYVELWLLLMIHFTHCYK